MNVEAILAIRTASVDETLVRLREAAAVFKSIPDHVGTARSQAHLAQCALREGRVREALVAAEEADQLLTTRGLRSHENVYVRNALAEAAVRAAETAERAERKAALKRSARACRRAIGYAKGVRPGLPGALRLQGTHEWLEGRTAAARKWWSQSLDVAAEMGARYDTAATCLEMGRRLGDASSLELAEEILSQIGARFDAGRANRLLGELALREQKDVEARNRFEKSVAFLEQVKAGHELALAYAAYGRFHRQQARTAEARDYFTRALEIFERLGTQPDSETDRVRAELALWPAS